MNKISKTKVKMPTPTPQDRQAWLSTLAKAPARQLLDAWQHVPTPPDFEWVRPPEFGSVMVQGRTGSTGDAFHLGEVTVTRCTLRLADGTLGHGYRQGRHKAAAQITALCDALLQQGHEPLASHIAQHVVQSLAQAQAQAQQTLREKAAATKVDFFTLVRGDD